jgi:hypothetical protein
MPVLLLVTLLAIAPVSSPLQPAGRSPLDEKCPNARSYFAANSRNAEARRLDQLPPGRLELTVVREVDGCPIPAVLREGISGWPAGRAESAAQPRDPVRRQPR